MAQPIPHFATISYAFATRFPAEVIERTHIKANVNMKKSIKKVIPQTVRHYEEYLMEEVNQDREAHGKKPFDDDPKPPKEKTICESTTDPESGIFHKGEHKKCIAYEAHTVCDRNNFVLDVSVTPGNVHDSVAFDGLYHRVTKRFRQIEVATMDSAYKTPWIYKQIIDDGRIPSLPYKRPMAKNGNFPWYEYVHGEYFDCIRCPQNKY